MMAKKVLAFDLDGTLAPSKSSLPREMGVRMAELLRTYQICVISGGKFGQFETQLIDGLPTDTSLTNLHIMPTCGTQYYRFEDNLWHQVYAENFTDDEKGRIIQALNEGIDALSLREPVTYGPIIEDRGSQITFSALGQDVVAELGEKGVELKDAWDPEHTKKVALRDRVAASISDFEVRVGGGTSIDITKPGIDKAYGMAKLMEILKVEKGDVMFFGDRLEPGGNDYPVLEAGIDSIAVKDWRDTLIKLASY